MSGCLFSPCAPLTCRSAGCEGPERIVDVYDGPGTFTWRKPLGAETVEVALAPGRVTVTSLVVGDPFSEALADLRADVLAPIVVARLRVERWEPAPCPRDWRPARG